MPFDYFGVISKYEKDREMSAVDKSCATTSQSGGIKSEMKSSKLFELTLASSKTVDISFCYML